MSNKKFAGVLGTSLQSALQRSQQDAPPTEVPLDLIQPNPDQPRRHFGDNRLKELVDSIRERGVLQPIMLRHLDGGRYEIVFGERRYRAAILAGLSVIPAMVRQLDAKAAAMLSAIENLQREDLNPYEDAYYKLALVSERLNVSPEELMTYLPNLRRRVSKDKDVDHPEHVEQLEALFKELGGAWQTFAVHGLRVLSLPEVILSVLRAGQLEYSKAILISQAPEEHHSSLLRTTIDEELSVTQLRDRIARLARHPARSATPLSRARSLVTPRKYNALTSEQQQKADKLLKQLIDLFDSTL